MLPRYYLARILYFGQALFQGRIGAAVRADFAATFKIPKKLAQRRQIMKSRKISNTELIELIAKDLPTSAKNLRVFRNRLIFWRDTEKGKDV